MAGGKLLSFRDFALQRGARQLIRPCSFVFQVGEWILLQGDNGVGKSSLLKAILQEVAYEGEIVFGSEDVQLRRDDISYIPQEQSLDWNFPIRVFDVAMMGLYDQIPWWRPISVPVRTKVENLLQQVGLGSFIYQTISCLSGGQRQKLLLVRALLQEPALILCDESLAHIDDRSRQEFHVLLQKAVAEGACVVLVYHGAHLPRGVDRVLTLADAKLSWKELKDELGEVRA